MMINSRWDGKKQMKTRVTKIPKVKLKSSTFSTSTCTCFIVWEYTLGLISMPVIVLPESQIFQKVWINKVQLILKAFMHANHSKWAKENSLLLPCCGRVYSMCVNTFCPVNGKQSNGSALFVKIWPMRQGPQHSIHLHTNGYNIKKKSELTKSQYDNTLL